MKYFIDKLKEIETLVELSIGKTMTEDKATDIYSITNELMSKVKKMDTDNESYCVPHFWFMCDNHTFIKLEGNSLQEIRDHAVAVAKDNTYGMVCPVRIYKGSKEIRKVGEPAHVDGQGKVDLGKWYDALINDDFLFNYKFK